MGVLVGLLFWSAVLQGGLLWNLLVVLVIVLGFRELDRLLRLQQCQPSTSAFYLAVVPLTLNAVTGQDYAFMFWLTVASWYTFFLALFKRPRVSMPNIGATLFAILYVGYFPLHFVLLRQLPNGLAYVLLTLMVVAAADIGAYYVGKRFGKHLLAPELSPKKTREGLVGGVLAGLAVGQLGGASFGLPLAHTAVLSTLLVVVGVLGDLVESKLKRDSGVKDSGTALASHGGVLDRVDSYLFAGGVAYYYVHWVMMRNGLVRDLMDWWPLAGLG